MEKNKLRTIRRKCLRLKHGDFQIQKTYGNFSIMKFRANSEFISRFSKTNHEMKENRFMSLRSKVRNVVFLKFRWKLF